jgi:hypothetical protein
MKRRVFLITGAIVAMGVSTAGLLRWLGLAPSADPDSPNAASLEAARPERPAGAAESQAEASSHGPIFPPEDHALLFILTDLIVPREGEHPAASEIDLLPRLEGWIRSSERRVRTYRKNWPAMLKVANRLTSADGKLNQVKLAKRMHTWGKRFRKQKRVHRAIVPFFEQFRRDVMRAYYSSPEGWASMGYTGPAGVVHPADARSKAAEEPLT